MTLNGDGVTMRVVCGYNLSFNKNPDSSTTYQQHRCFFITWKKDLTCPCTKFWEDLVGQLKQWREDGNQLIVFHDANKNIYKKSIGKVSTDVKGLAMKEVVREFTRQPVGPTFVRGSKPIDGVWATSDITVSNACIMPAGYSIGDHCMFVIDLKAKDIIGQASPRVIQATSWCLNTRIPRVFNKYIRILEEKVLRHQLIERMGAAHTSSKSCRKLIKHIIRIDRELGQYMRNAEKKWQKLKSGQIPFSPEASVWIKRTQVYRLLLKYHNGRDRNRGNFKRSVRRCGIVDAMSILQEEINARLNTCIKQCNHFCKHRMSY